jgi:hypothetical protein
MIAFVGKELLSRIVYLEQASDGRRWMVGLLVERFQGERLQQDCCSTAGGIESVMTRIRNTMKEK